MAASSMAFIRLSSLFCEFPTTSLEGLPYPTLTTSTEHLRVRDALLQYCLVLHAL